MPQAVEQVLGWPAGSFLAAYLTNVSAGDVIAVEHSPIGAAIQAVAVDGGFEGKVGDLLGTDGPVEGDDQVLYFGAGLGEPFAENGAVRAAHQVECPSAGAPQPSGGSF